MFEWVLNKLQVLSIGPYHIETSPVICLGVEMFSRSNILNLYGKTISYKTNNKKKNNLHTGFPSGVGVSSIRRLDAACYNTKKIC